MLDRVDALIDDVLGTLELHIVEGFEQHIRAQASALVPGEYYLPPGASWHLLDT